MTSKVRLYNPNETSFQQNISSRYNWFFTAGLQPVWCHLAWGWLWGWIIWNFGKRAILQFNTLCIVQCLHHIPIKEICVKNYFREILSKDFKEWNLLNYAQKETDNKVYMLWLMIEINFASNKVGEWILKKRHDHK